MFFCALAKLKPFFLLIVTSVKVSRFFHLEYLLLYERHLGLRSPRSWCLCVNPRCPGEVLLLGWFLEGVRRVSVARPFCVTLQAIEDETGETVNTTLLALN